MVVISSPQGAITRMVIVARDLLLHNQLRTHNGLLPAWQVNKRPHIRSYSTTTPSRDKQVNQTNLDGKFVKFNNSLNVKGSEDRYIYSYLCNRVPRKGSIDQNLLTRLFELVSNRTVHQSNPKLERLEEQIDNSLDLDLTIEDLAIIGLAYFKTKTSIVDDNILKKLTVALTKVLPNIDLSKPGLCSVIKSIRYSAKDSDCRDNVVDLVNEIKKQFSTDQIASNTMNMCHILKLMESYRIYDEEFFETICDYMFENLEKLRIKDIQYILTSLSNFRYDIDEDGTKMRPKLRQRFDYLSNQIIEESRYDSFKQSFHIIPLLRAFAIYGYYNEVLIKYTNTLLRDHSKNERMLDSLESEITLLLLRSCLKIEADGLDLVLPPKVLTLAQNKIRQAMFINNIDVRKPLKADELARLKRMSISASFFELSKSLSSTSHLSESCYKFKFQNTMAHQNYFDVIISKNCEAPGSYRNATSLPRIVPSGQKHCLLLASRPFDMVDNESRLSGYKSLMKRILSKIGYTVIRVDPSNVPLRELSSLIKRELDSI